MKIVFVDIDGTILLCNEGLIEPTKKTRDAFKLLKANGHLVFIASGRCRSLLKKEILDLKADGYILCNGAYSELKGEVLRECVFTKQMIDAIIAFCKSNDGIYYLENNRCIYTNDLTSKTHIDFINCWQTDGNYTDHPLPSGEHINMAMMAFKTPQTVIKAKNELSDIFDICPHIYPYSCDVNYKGISKGKAITDILKIKGIAKEDAYAFGDGSNDLEMIQAVKYGFAMANGVAELKKIAFDIADNVLNDGFYQTLLKYGLINAH